MQQNSASQVPWHENDALFRSLQRTGRGYEGYVAALLIGAGLGVEVQPMQTRPEYTDREAYRDYRDLIVVTPKGKRAAIEVKSRSLSFGCADTFPYDDIFVDTKKIVDAKGPPAALVCVSQKTLATVVVPGSTKPLWGTKISRDRLRGIKSEWYVCPKKHLKTLEELTLFLLAI